MIFSYINVVEWSPFWKGLLTWLTVDALFVLCLFVISVVSHFGFESMLCLHFTLNMSILYDTLSSLTIMCRVAKNFRCCHISPDSANGRRTDRKNAKNVYPVEKVVSVAMKVVAEGERAHNAHE